MAKATNGHRRTVTWGKWCVSFTTGTDLGGAVLSAFVPYDLPVDGTEPRGAVLRCKTRRGEADGMVFATVDEAREYALDHGYLQEYRREHDDWYERHREWTREWRRSQGLPVG